MFSIFSPVFPITQETLPCQTILGKIGEGTFIRQPSILKQIGISQAAQLCSRVCVNSLWLSLWVPSIFDPLHRSTSLNRSLQKFVHDFNCCAKFDGNRSMGASGQNITIFYLYPLFKQLTYTGETTYQIFTLGGSISNDADSCRGVPFGLRLILQPIYGIKLPKNPNRRGRK